MRPAITFLNIQLSNSRDFKGFCSLGVSNEIIAESAEITFEDGILIVIEARD